MFNIGPMEFVVLALVGIVVLGPDRLPQFARDAARLIRTLRDMATGARQQLREELGPEFADMDLRNLNPRTAVQRAVFGDEMPDLRRYSPSSFVRDTLFGEEPESEAAESTFGDEPVKPVSMHKANGASANGASANGASANGASANGASANGASANGASARGGSAPGTSGGGTPGGGTSAPGTSGERARPRPRPRPRTTYDDDAT